ncbi:MAG: tetratricopeptide repeat-containing glycosyltransferase family protein [Syntrophobacteraceae bacterium]|jgi:tetratricopeptide (TPR) repeat protein
MAITVQAMPNHPHAQKIVDLMARSISLRQEKRHEEALRCIEEATGFDPQFFPVLVEKGIILFELARYEESIECFDLFLKFSGNSQVRELRDNCLKHALANYDRILAGSPPNVEVLLKRGDILQRLHRYDDAVYTYNLALEIYVNDIVDVLNRRGNSLLYLDRPEEALESYNRALELAPRKSSLLFNRANVLQKLARMDEALESYDRALSCKPDLAEAKMEKSHCRLATGDFQKGLPEYESRWETAQLKSLKSGSSKPLWLGEENLAGKIILLWAEQGFGDTIQFLRYVPLAAQTAGLTILRVPAVLRSLAQTLDCPVSIITFGDALPPHDFNCPLMSLPLAFGTTLESIPADVPYLSAKPDQVEKWRNQLGPRIRPRIGLVWAGRRREPVNRTRDMGLEVFDPLRRLDVEIISLQKEIPDQDRNVIESMPQITCLGEKLSDFADTAALIENLDMVISVDTVVAHLAGALGKPVWIMLRHSGEWRWLVGRSDSPWYPTARIFRQKTPGDWAGVVSDVIQQLQALIVHRKPGNLQDQSCVQR